MRPARAKGGQGFVSGRCGREECGLYAVCQSPWHGLLEGQQGVVIPVRVINPGRRHPAALLLLRGSVRPRG